MDSETLPIVIGVGLLIVGLFLILNITTLIWMRSALGKKRAAPESGEEAKEPSGAQKMKSWIGVIAALVGLMTTIGGAMKSCDSAPAAPSIAVEPPPYYPPITPPVVPPKQDPNQQQPLQQQWSSQCCTQYGNCQMLQMGAIGQGCFCTDQFGNYATGAVCH